MLVFQYCVIERVHHLDHVCEQIAYMIVDYFFFSSRRRHTRFDCDWSSDVCSSDLVAPRCLNGILAFRRGFADRFLVTRLPILVARRLPPPIGVPYARPDGHASVSRRPAGGVWWQQRAHGPRQVRCLFALPDAGLVSAFSSTQAHHRPRRPRRDREAWT